MRLRDRIWCWWHNYCPIHMIPLQGIFDQSCPTCDTLNVLAYRAYVERRVREIKERNACA
jgi:hypothetical protein